MDKPVGVKFVLSDLPRKFVEDHRQEDIEEAEGEEVTQRDLKIDNPEDQGFLNELLDTFGGKFHNED